MRYLIGIVSTIGDECIQDYIPTNALQNDDEEVDAIQVIHYHISLEMPSIKRATDDITISNRVGNPNKRYNGALKVRYVCKPKSCLKVYITEA